MQKTKTIVAQVSEKYMNTKFLEPKERKVVGKMPANVRIITERGSSSLPPQEYVAALKRNYHSLNKLSEKDVDKKSAQAVLGIAMDYEAKADGIRMSTTSKQNPFAKIKVTVNTLMGTKPSPGYRVIYAPMGQLGDKNLHVKFRKLSTPTDERLTQGTYWFWTETDENSPKKGKALRIPVSDNGKGICDPIDLPIP
jgi:hypothetical protein